MQALAERVPGLGVELGTVGQDQVFQTGYSWPGTSILNTWMFDVLTRIVTSEILETCTLRVVHYPAGYTIAVGRRDRVTEGARPPRNTVGKNLRSGICWQERWVQTMLSTRRNKLSHQNKSTNKWSTCEKTSVRAYKAWLQVVFSHSDLIANLKRDISKIGHIKDWWLRPVWEIGIIPILFELHIVKDAEEDLNKEDIAQYM